MEKRCFQYNKEFHLESGEILPKLEICYHISADYKKSLSHKPVIWITHALTANSDPSDWWDVLVGNGKFFDPAKYTIVCANILGSCYGTTGSASVNPRTGKPYMLDFPKTTIRDIVACHELLRKEIGIQQIDLLIGGSVGGFQAIEWSIINSSVIKNMILLACNARITPWGNAFNESQRMALYADRTFEKQERTGGKKGLAAARSIALISYRSYSGYNISQKETNTETLFNHRAQSYQQYQGEKLVKRFDPYSYLSMLNLTDSHNIGRTRGGVEQALKLITARVLCIGIDNDYLFPPQEQKYIADHVPNGEFKKITSLFGHDGFLLEWQQIQQVIELSGMLQNKI
ncbi:MAG: homoserine O-acetyltransferase [Bacteroidales bacterium]